MEPVSFYLMNQRGWSVLSAVLDGFGAGIIRAVVTSRDTAMSKDYYDEIVSLCGKHKVPVYDRTSVDIPKKGFKIAIGWRWLIPDSTNLIVLHDSLLPRYRGFTPLVNMLINGEQKIGVTALYASEEYDKGEIIGQLAVPALYPLRISAAIEQVSSLYEKLVLDILRQFAQGKRPASSSQEEALATYSLWREEADYRINWNLPAPEIRRFIDAVGFPYKGASSRAGDKTVRIQAAEEAGDVRIENRDAGKIIFMNEGKPVVVCGQGLLQITDIQDEEGKSLLPYTKFRTRFC